MELGPKAAQVAAPQEGYFSRDGGSQVHIFFFHFLVSDEL